jgi:hypothetical protein
MGTLRNGDLRLFEQCPMFVEQGMRHEILRFLRRDKVRPLILLFYRDFALPALHR